MPVSVRLDKETEELLEKMAKQLGKTKSEVIKKSIIQYCTPFIKRQSLYEFIKERIEKWPGSRRGNLAVRSEEILKERLREKHKRKS